jgi:hypothetical protein
VDAVTRKPSRFYAVRVDGQMWRVCWFDAHGDARTIRDCLSHNSARSLARHLNDATTAWKKATK